MGQKKKNGTEEEYEIEEGDTTRWFHLTRKSDGEEFSVEYIEHKNSGFETIETPWTADQKTANEISEAIRKFIDKEKELSKNE